MRCALCSVVPIASTAMPPVALLLHARPSGRSPWRCDVDSELARWRKLIKDIGAKAE